MGVCCIVFDIDGMLFEFFMNFLNIEKKKIQNFVFQYLLFPALKINKKIRGGWGGVNFFLY